MHDQGGRGQEHRRCCGETYDHDTADDPPAEGEEEEEVETDQLVGVDEKDIE